MGKENKGGEMELTIKIIHDEADNFCASVAVDKDEIIGGYGTDPYMALRDLIDEMEYQHEYFRPD